jgi:hypothetical protein
VKTIPAVKGIVMFSHRFLRIAGHALFGLVLVVVLAGVFGGVVMLAWNAVMPAISGLPAITFGQAVAGLVLVRILTGRFTHPHRGRSRCGSRRWPWRRDGADAASRHSAALYTAWWESEGEVAFQAFAARHLGEDAGPGGHGQ